MCLFVKQEANPLSLPPMSWDKIGPSPLSSFPSAHHFSLLRAVIKQAPEQTRKDDVCADNHNKNTCYAIPLGKIRKNTSASRIVKACF